MVADPDPSVVRRAADLYFDSKLEGEDANYDLIRALPACLRTGHVIGERLGIRWRLGLMGISYTKDTNAMFESTFRTAARADFPKVVESYRRAALVRLIDAMPRAVLRCAAADVQQLYEECVVTHFRRALPQTRCSA